ncbi:MAG: GGDEF domain-containing protein [Psychromonas sp.]
MKYIERYKRALFVLFFLLNSPITQAIGFSETSMPVMLKYAHQVRHSDPNRCIDLSEKYRQKNRIQESNNKSTSTTVEQDNATMLLAYCHAQLDQYVQSFALLLPLAQAQKDAETKVRTLHIIALEIPKDERLQLSNATIIRLLSEIQHISINNKPLDHSENTNLLLLLTLTKLSLDEDFYRDAHIYIEEIKSLLKNSKSQEEHGWLSYYQGLYYDKVGQTHLSSLYFQNANQIAEKYKLIKLSSLVKNSTIQMYQSKYRFKLAFEIANQNIELQMRTRNKVKQATSIIQFAILKRQNKEAEEALIYLFNALEIIKSYRHRALLAYVYLELGRTYASLAQQGNSTNDIELAQKYLQNSRVLFNQLGKVHFKIETLLLLAKLNIINNDPAVAILQLEKSLQLSSQNYPLLRVQAYEMLALSYELISDPEQAIQHFKNFHALQNNIKERLFKLQQLQISEQLQLLEQTLEQDKLEVLNEQLRSKSEIYQNSAYIFMILFLLTGIGFVYKLGRNKKLRKSARVAIHNINFHARSKLPTQQNHINQFSSIYRGRPQFYALVDIPFLSGLNDLVGDLLANEIERKLGIQLTQYFSNDTNIFHIRDNQILFITEQKNYTKAADFAFSIEKFFDQFTLQNQLPQNISTGVVAFPFLQNVSRAITASRTIHLNSLALFAANQIRVEKEKSSWIELYAIDNLQPAFFDGDLWELGQVAINKGLVKVNGSDPDYNVNWTVKNED